MDLKVTKDKPVDPEEMENEETKELRGSRFTRRKWRSRAKRKQR